MIKAEELLKRWLKNGPRDADLLIYGDTKSYLNHKEKLVVDSEWVCEVTCFVSKRDEVEVVLSPVGVIFTISNIFTFNGIDLVECIHWNKMVVAIPIYQFLACFSPLEKEQSDE